MNSRLGLGFALGLLSAFAVGCASKPAAAPVTTAASSPATTTSSAAKADSSKSTHSSSKAEKTMTCTNGADKRILEIEVTESKGCEVMYTKNGNRSSIAKGTNGNEHCEKTLEKVKTKLQAAGFTCEG